MRALVIATTLGGLLLLARKRTRNPQPLPPPPTTRQYHDRLAHKLEVALSYGNKPLWDEVCEECRKAGREDLPEHKRKEWPELAEWLDRT